MDDNRKQTPESRLASRSGGLLIVVVVVLVIAVMVAVVHNGKTKTKGGTTKAKSEL